MSPRVEIYSLSCLSVELPSFAYICFSFIRFILFSLNVLFAFKNITQEIGIADYSEYYFFS